jgi:CheY-like chemotaxis protein
LPASPFQSSSLASRAKRPQIIAVTANVYESDREACAEVGMVDFLGKPLIKSNLERCLRRARLRLAEQRRPSRD